MSKTLNPLATELNDLINKTHPVIYNLLSERGRAIYFPKTGILGQSAEAKGKRINATIGIAVEDDGSPVRLESIASQVSLAPKEVFPYAPSYGKPELRAKWQEKIREKNPSLTAPISLPVTTNALTHGLSVCAFLFVNPGDEIICTDKFWGNYRLTFELDAGGTIKTFNTFKAGGFDLEAFKTALTANEAKKKIVILNFPNNPAGYTPTEAEADSIIEIIHERAEAGDELIILLDDAYFGLVFEVGVYRESLFARLTDMHQNILAVKIDGATKEDYVWGLRVGFLTYGIKGAIPEIYAALEAKTAGAIRGQISNVSHLSQSLVLAAFNDPNYATEKQAKYELLKSRYLKIKEVLADEKYRTAFTALPFNSGYFMCLQLAEGLDAETVRKVLLEKYETGTIALPGRLLRIAFSSVAESLIPEMIENIYKACQETTI